MSISALDKAQWFSVVKNAVFSGVSAFLVVLEGNLFSINRGVLVGAGAAGITAIFKFVEKLFTPVA